MVSPVSCFYWCWITLFLFHFILFSFLLWGQTRLCVSDCRALHQILWLVHHYQHPLIIFPMQCIASYPVRMCLSEKYGVFSTLSNCKSSKKGFHQNILAELSAVNHQNHRIGHELLLVRARLATHTHIRKSSEWMCSSALIKFCPEWTERNENEFVTWENFTIMSFLLFSHELYYTHRI